MYKIFLNLKKGFYQFINMLRLFVLSLSVALVWGHAALYEPPGRSSMWRFGFKTPRNDDDAEIYCGGITKLWDVHKGKCGICGDAWDLKEPRPNEDGGKYGKGIVVRTYKSGQEIDVRINIVANHEGYFEFKLCPVQDGVAADQACLDKHPIAMADGSGYRYTLPGNKRGNLDLKLKLPDGFKCERCVFQFHWKCANNWGFCEDGKGRMGCGPQEYFRGCADVKIV